MLDRNNRVAFLNCQATLLDSLQIGVVYYSSLNQACWAFLSFVIKCKLHYEVERRLHKQQGNDWTLRGFMRGGSDRKHLRKANEPMEANDIYWDG